MSRQYKQILYFYRSKMWNIDKVRDAVKMNRITPEEFELITGEPYEDAQEVQEDEQPTN